jgi:WD40 repeat protein
MPCQSHWGKTLPRMTLIFCALVLASIVFLTIAASQDSVDIPELVHRLSSPNYATREAAFNALNKVGMPALEALWKVANDGSDEESRRRALRLISGIQDRLYYSEIRMLRGHRGEVNSLAFTPDSKLLASAGSDQTIRLWDIVSGKNIATLRAPFADACVVDFCPKGKLLASAGGDGTIHFWDLETAKSKGTLHGHDGPVYALTFSPDGKTLVSGGLDQTVRLWDVATGRQRASLRGHHNAVWSVAFASDGKSLISGSWDGSLKLWSMTTLKEMRTFKVKGTEINCVAFVGSCTGVIAAAGDGTLRYWDLAADGQQRVAKTLMPIIMSMSTSEDGKTLAFASASSRSKSGDIVIWDIGSGRMKAVIKNASSTAWSVRFAPTARMLAGAYTDGTIRLWDMTKPLERKQGRIQIKKDIGS